METPDQVMEEAEEAQSHAGALLEFRDLRNRRYTLLVYGYLLGQFRIQITDTELPDANAPDGHGHIVLQLCTYRPGEMAEVVVDLKHAEEPLVLAMSWATPYNYSGDRIRLDNKPGDRGT